MVTGVIVFIFGGLTIYLNDETFIKLKPTIVNLLFCGTLLIGLLFGKSFLKTVLGETVAIEDEGWRKLTLRWGLFFGFLAILLSSLLMALALASTDKGFIQAAKLVVAAHIPLMLIEGIITMFTVSFLAKVQPEFLRMGKQ